ncbi:MAG: HEAT repeat domain-containing protein [Verrucomicrobiales bacterium]|nr:HEAT repeat domain-containing protein [Verrucomicrobiales bacterium]
MKSRIFHRSGRPAAAVLLGSATAAAAFGAEFRLGEHTFTLPDGFEIELVAGPPLVDRPMMADFDDAGRLYVADSSGSNDPVNEQLEAKPHRIVRLEDTDGDGRFDRRVVFADRMMFPEGVLWLDGAVYSGAPPTIWRLRDTDGDGVADERLEWHQGKTLTGCANDLHGPYAGPDGWVYWCKGAFAEQTYERPGQRTISDRAAHVFRCRPDGSAFDSVMSGGMDNPVEVAFDDMGEAFFTTTFFHHPEAGRRDAVVHCVYGAVYPKVHGVLDDLQRTGELLPPLVELGPAAACSLARYESPAWGEEFRGNLFSSLFNLRKVMRHRLERAGSTFVSVDEDFLVSDNRDFHPTDVIEDADGSLLVIDTGGWYKICCPTSQLAKPDVLGAIYRIRRTGQASVADPRGQRLGWTEASPAELAARLADPRPAVQRRAIQALAATGDRAVPVLERTLERATGPHVRRSAVWTLTQIDADSARAAVRRALDDPDPTVQQAALHSVGVHRDATATTRVIGFLDSTNLFLQRKAAEALGRIGDPRAAPELLAAAGRFRELLARDGRASASPKTLDDCIRVHEHALVFALIEIANPAATAAGLESSHPAVRRAALIALDQMDGGGVAVDAVAPLLGSEDALLRETADWIAGHHPDWGDALAGFFAGRLEEPHAGGPEDALLIGQLARFTGSAAVQALLARVAGNGNAPAANRRIAVLAMGAAPAKTAPESWWPALERCLAERGELAVAALRAARAHPEASTPASWNRALLDLARDDTRSDSERLEGLRVAAQLPSPLDSELFALLTTNLTPAVAPELRSAAVSVVGRSQAAPHQFLLLARSLRVVGPMELNPLLETFEGVTNESVGMAMVAALEASPTLSAVRGDLLQKRLAQFPPTVQEAGQALLRRLDVDPAAQAARIETMLSELGRIEGDIRRGQAIFNSPQTACATCHAMGYVGGRVGPDLTRIGQIRSERDLLEAIVAPSASFVRSYEPVRVFTREDEDYSGILADETAAELVLVVGADTSVRVPKDQVTEMRPGTVSIMPAGMADQLNRQELADLLAFLKATRWGAR